MKVLVGPYIILLYLRDSKGRVVGELIINARPGFASRFGGNRIVQSIKRH